MRIYLSIQNLLCSSSLLQKEFIELVESGIDPSDHHVELRPNMTKNSTLNEFAFSPYNLEVSPPAIPNTPQEDF